MPFKRYRNVENSDEWVIREGGHGHPQCSFCGSMEPNDFLHLMEKGNKVIPTDKDYKAYITAEDGAPDGELMFWHLDTDSARRFSAAYQHGKMTMAFPGRFYIKPFFLSVEETQPFSFTTILTLEESVEDGHTISVVSPVFEQLLRELERNPDFLYSISPGQWEEVIAASYDRIGFDEVILTPRSGDLGRDVVATKKGFGSVRFIEQVKAYKPGHLVTADEVRALLGVLHSDHAATKAIFTTTSHFAPLLKNDRLIRPHLPFRLELIDRDMIIDRLLKRNVS